MIKAISHRPNRKNHYNDPERKTYKCSCRYCDRDVVYHQNEYGSRVFFEDFGKPWDKHGCPEFLNTARASLYFCGAGEQGIYWVKRGYDRWYRLDGLSENINSLRHKGVYIIWYFDVLHTARTVKVGSGQLRERLTAERRDPEVQKYAGRPLYVTWALVSPKYMRSIVISLSQKLQPFAGQRFSGNTGIFVGLPSGLTWGY